MHEPCPFNNIMIYWWWPFKFFDTSPTNLIIYSLSCYELSILELTFLSHKFHDKLFTHLCKSQCLFSLFCLRNLNEKLSYELHFMDEYSHICVMFVQTNCRLRLQPLDLILQRL
jgi:hypothetical protein